MTTILLQHPNQCWCLLLLSWEPHGFACVKRKERDNLPAEWAKDESHETFHDRIDNSSNSNTSKKRLYISCLIHWFPALACNYTPGITLVLSKLVSLDSDHGNKQHNNHVGRRSCRTPVMLATATIDEYVSIIYLVFASIASIALVTV